jgi:hypothetical protein
VGPIEISYWVRSAQGDRTNMELLTRAAAATCNPARPNRYAIFGVEYPHFNANSAAFYSAKLRRELGYRCYYTSLGYAATDVEKALQRVDDIQADFVITFRPENLPQEADFLNKIARPVAERMASGGPFKPAAEVGPGLIVYERR